MFVLANMLGNDEIVLELKNKMAEELLLIILFAYVCSSRVCEEVNFVLAISCWLTNAWRSY
jgi:hypothetical protein